MNEKTTERLFKEKYLEYESKITLEIFTLVWNRLIELGYKSFDNATIEERYDEFKGRYSYFKTTQDHPNEFNCYTSGNPYSKTTVKEILGYNPFIKETVTSKDWSKATEEEILEEAKRMYPIGFKVKLIGLNAGGDFGNEVRFTKNKFYTYGERKLLFIDGNLLIFDNATWAEIESLPEVKVKNETKEVIPEYVELLSGFDTPRTGEIFDTKQPIPAYPLWTKSWTWEYLLTAENHKHYFKPSTKEAFEAQNKVEEKSQFIVGKWYKCKGYDYIIKYFGVKKSKNGDAILYSDLIYSDKSYKSCPKGDVGVGYTTNKYWYELTDLSEIQQYLPDRHVDKIVKPVDKQVSKEPTRLSFYVKYCDEFTEDLLKSLLEWSQKNTTLEDRGRDNSFKGLKEDEYFLFDNFGLAAPKSRLYEDRQGFGYGVDNNKQGCLQEYSIKEVKELIGYKKQKPIEKWTVGGYVVAINNGNANGKPKDKYQIGFINKITHSFSDGTCGLEFSSNCCNKSDFKCFATKSEAEEFAKTLVEPIKEEVKQAVHCTTQEEWDFFILKEVNKSYAMSKEPFKKDSAITFDNSWDRVDYLKNNGYQILSFQEWCDLNGHKMEKEFAKTLVEPIKKETKQPLKQAVHCTTQKEWDFVLSKFNPRKLSSTSFTMYSDRLIITTDESNKSNIGCYGSVRRQQSEYQILSFQEWCDLNGYKMEKELKQVAGVWYKWVKHRNDKDGLKYVKPNYFSKNILHYLERINVDGTHVYVKSECVWDEELVEVSLSEIQQYLPEGHPDKISSVKDTVILNESSIGKFISFRYNVGNRFYNKALIIKENGNIYLLNNCRSNNDGHKNKSIYKYSLKFRNFKEVEYFCKEIKFLTTEEVLGNQRQKPIQSDGLGLKTKNSHVTIDYIKIELKEITKLHEFEFNYLPEPE